MLTSQSETGVAAVFLPSDITASQRNSLVLNDYQQAYYESDGVLAEKQFCFNISTRSSNKEIKPKPPVFTHTSVEQEKLKPKATAVSIRNLPVDAA